MELPLSEGWVEPELAEELPGIGLVLAPVEVRPGPSPKDVKRRLKALADRYTGGKVIHMRQDPVPWAYRVFARQVGVDPDTDRTPVERIALERLKHGGLRSESLLDDALTIATAETGVPVIALDPDRLEGDPGLRLSRAGETLGRAGRSRPGRSWSPTAAARWRSCSARSPPTPGSRRRPSGCSCARSAWPRCRASRWRRHSGPPVRP